MASDSSDTRTYNVKIDGVDVSFVSNLSDAAKAITDLFAPKGDAGELPVDSVWAAVVVAATNNDIVVGNTVESPLSDTDYSDYKYRYILPDSYVGNDDQPNVSYLRIITADDSRKIIFPYDQTSEDPAFRLRNMESGSNGTRHFGITHNRFKQFILTHISESFQQRVQVTETSRDPTISFFGERMKSLSLGGYLKNSAENPWTTNMVYLWEKYMSGSVLAENGWIAEFFCNNALYRGYPIGFSMSVQAGADLVAQFSMQLAVKERIRAKLVPTEA